MTELMYFIVYDGLEKNWTVYDMGGGGGGGWNIDSILPGN